MLPNVCLFFVIFLSSIFIISVLSEVVSMQKSSNNQTTLQLLKNSNLVVVNFLSKTTDLEIQIKIDLKYYSDLRGPEAKDNEEGDEVTAKKFSLGFDAGNFLDMFTITLLPTEEHDEGVINMEAIVADSVQDYNWNKKDGILVADVMQNYQLTFFEVTKNDTMFTATVVRPWLTCDVQDFQFPLKPIQLWWMLETSESSSSAVKAPLVMEQITEQINDENSTVAEAPEGESPSVVQNDDGVIKTDPVPEEPATIDQAGMTTKGSGSGTQNDQVETLETLKQRDFRGPVTLDLTSFVLTTSSSILFSACGQGGKRTNEVFVCSTNDVAITTTGISIFATTAPSTNKTKVADIVGPKAKVLPCGQLSSAKQPVHMKNLTRALVGKPRKSGQSMSVPSVVSIQLHITLFVLKELSHNYFL